MIGFNRSNTGTILRRLREASAKACIATRNAPYAAVKATNSPVLITEPAPEAADALAWYKTKKIPIDEMIEKAEPKTATAF